MELVAVVSATAGELVSTVAFVVVANVVVSSMIIVPVAHVFVAAACAPGVETRVFHFSGSRASATPVAVAQASDFWSMVIKLRFFLGERVSLAGLAGNLRDCV